MPRSAPQPAPTGPRPQYEVSCTTCNKACPWTVCKSNDHGNHGHWQAICFDAREDGTTCNFVHFGSPQSSPVPKVTRTRQRTRSAQLPAPTHRACIVVGCRSTRVNKNCARNTCRKHCKHLGGCHLTDHAGSGVAINADSLELEDDPEDTGDTHAVPPDNDDKPIIPVPVETLHLPSPQPHAPPTTPTVEASTANMPDNSRLAHPRVPRARTVPAHNRAPQEDGPHYCMQMPEVFTEQLAETSKRNEVQRQRRADEIEAQNRARYHTVVYVWVEDGSQPNVFEFQSGILVFNWPHLSLSEEVLSMMGLAATSVNKGVGSASIIQVWNHSRREWRGVQPGYLITVVEGQPVLLKSPNITDCVDLDSCIRRINDSPPNIRTHLAAECAAVHADLHNHNNALPDPNDVVFRPHVKLSTSPLELEVEALLLSKGKGKAKRPADRSPSALSNQSFRAKPSPTYSAYSIPSFGTPSPPPKPKRLVRRRGSSTAHARVSLGMLFNPIDIDDDVKVWPGDFYACDIAKCFTLCGAVGKRRQGVGAVFQKMFSASYVSTTFHVHRKRWEDAPATVTNRFVKAGRTEAGLWSKFMAETRS
ncbi:hypothetical protein C8R48DRAFT_675115 [Suillus tomentosus]|nr:hypothetical protein C8R48DRAFT_675115 [Suillus tomentosus]